MPTTRSCGKHLFTTFDAVRTLPYGGLNGAFNRPHTLAHIRALGAQMQGVFHDHQGKKSFGNGGCSNAYAWVVAALVDARQNLDSVGFAALGYVPAGARAAV